MCQSPWRRSLWVHGDERLDLLNTQHLSHVQLGAHHYLSVWPCSPTPTSPLPSCFPCRRHPRNARTKCPTPPFVSRRPSVPRLPTQAHRIPPVPIRPRDYYGCRHADTEEHGPLVLPAAQRTRCPALGVTGVEEQTRVPHFSSAGIALPSRNCCCASCRGLAFLPRFDSSSARFSLVINARVD